MVFAAMDIVKAHESFHTNFVRSMRTVLQSQSESSRRREEVDIAHFGLSDPLNAPDCNPAGPRLSEPQHSRTEARFLLNWTPQLIGRAAARRAAGRSIRLISVGFPPPHVGGYPGWPTASLPR